ncbi:MAG TPA: tetratricopeptide repeat protein, partial [Herpetosiphonaceae bacterium]|nr:tetratricopeptide repeat protein [Herpetosiphonaceae bacterium]
MEPAELAGRLASAGPEERASLLAGHEAIVDLRLARALKALYDETESSDPSRAAGATAALADVARAVDDQEASALAAWTTGMVALDAGRMEAAIGHLEDAEARFMALGQRHSAAATQVSKVIALAILGRYHEALHCGLTARDLFLEHGDILAAGKIEQNLGNIYFRRDYYAEAERYYRSARERFVAIGDQKQLVQIGNCLGTALTTQHKFRSAAPIYEEALRRAEQVGLAVTQAELEGNLGCLALSQGAYDEALDYLERSRRGFAALGMGSRSATAEQELADTYLDLNLAPEAVSIYTRIVPIFADLGMRAEHAHALAYSARAHLLLGQIEVARSLLAEARPLYVAEGSPVGEAMVALVEA